MYDLQIFFQRRRRMMTRVIALLVLGLGGMLAILPRADAHAEVAVSNDPAAYLLSPKSLSSQAFAAFNPLTHR